MSGPGSAPSERQADGGFLQLGHQPPPLQVQLFGHQREMHLSRADLGRGVAFGQHSHSAGSIFSRLASACISQPVSPRSIRTRPP